MDTPTRKRRRKAMRKDEIEGQAISIVRGEKQRWEVATAFITDRVSFKMRNLIRSLRKNYYGIFDQPIDQNTNLEKIWYPLTEINVEAVTKNIDIDQKDLNFRATNPDAFGITDLTRAYVKEKLAKMDFGQKLDDLERSLAIDGTVVWKTWEENKKLKVVKVDLLNVYIDPTSPSIKEAYRFTERSLMFNEEIEGMTGWINTEDIVPTAGLPRTDANYRFSGAGANSNVKMIDVYEMYGKIPESLITGDAKDTQEIEGHIVCSGLDSAGKERVHLIERNTDVDDEGYPIKPYEEVWYTRVPNRWYGRGIAEKLMMIQMYANIVFNVRINRSRISQMGLFKVKKGGGVTPQMLSKLQSNGVVVLDNLDDLQQLVVQEVGATSYKDEDTINSISERLTNAFEVVTGEALPASTPATNATIQNANAKSGFQIVKDQIGFFLQRWMDRQALPILVKEMTVGDFVRITTEEGNFNDIAEQILMIKTMEALDGAFAEGTQPTPQQLQAAMDDARVKLRKRDAFIELVKKIDISMLETHFFVTNEDMDVTQTISNLIQLIPAAPEYRDAMLSTAFDLMGLGQMKKSEPTAPQGAPQQAQAPVAPAGVPNPPPLLGNA